MLTPTTIIIGILCGLAIGLLAALFIKWIEKKLTAEPRDQESKEEDIAKK